MRKPQYVLITPVRDEVDHVGRTIEAVLRQTWLPKEWVIVSDGSTDGTDELIESVIQGVPWVTLIKRPWRPERDFAAVVRNTELGIAALTCRDSEYLGLLDADLEFHDEYFERVIGHFEANPRLGLAGGLVVDAGVRRERLPLNRLDVPGAVQFFRRECFVSLGHLFEVPGGGWDSLTCLVARMNGFETRLLTDLVVTHLKPRNSSESSQFRRYWQIGARDYAVGYSPGFALLKWARRMTERPLLIGGGGALLGYVSALVRGNPRVVPSEMIQFMRMEQRERVLAAFLPRRRAHRDHDSIEQGGHVD